MAASVARTDRAIGRAGRGVLAGSGAFRAMGRSLAFASAGFLSFAAAAQGLRSSITAASDLNEEINKANVVFRGSEKQVQTWSEHLRAAFGLTRGEALHTAATFGNMLVPMGFIRKQAASMSENLVSLAGDMASFNNASPVEILQALQAGLANQPRPLRRFGVFLTQARIAAEAFSSGIVKANVNMGKLRDAQTKVDIAQAQSASARKKFGANSIEAAKAELTLHNAERLLGKELAGNVPKLTNAQRTLAIYRIILKDTADAQGDAARTSGAFAGQLREEHAQVGNLQEKIGRLLMPTVLQYLTAGNKWLSQNKNQQAVLHTVKDAVHLFTAAVAGAKEVLGPLAHLARNVARAVGGWKNAFAIITSLYLANKFIKLASAIRLSRLEAGRLRGAVLGLKGLTVAIGIDLIINKSDRDKLLKFIQGPKDSQQNKSLHDLINVGQGIADAATQIAHGNVGHSGHTLGFHRKPAPLAESPGLPPGRSPEDAHTDIHSAARQAWEKDTAAAKAAMATAKAHRRAFTAAQAAFELPFQLQLDEAKGQAFRNNAAILKAAKEARAFILKALPHLKGAHLLEAYGLLGQANDTIASAAKEAADKAKADAQRAREKLRAAREKMQQAIENVRSQIGDLFQGPILAPTEAQSKASLGLPGPKASDLTKDLRAQTALFARFNKDLAILAKRGASKELLKELRAKGPADIAEIEALAKASRKDLQAFFKAFGRRESLVQRVARVEMRATQVTIRAARLTLERQRRGTHHHRAAVRHRPPRARMQTMGVESSVSLSGTASREETHIHNISIDGQKVTTVVSKRQKRNTELGVSQVRGRHGGRNAMGPV